MNKLPSDQAARERFTRDWGTNLAVVANAGSGKTTAISRRLAAMARSPDGAALLAATAVVTYTKKAADQIGQRARRELLSQMEEAGEADMGALARLDRVFFGTIHSFCITLARAHGSALGVHLNPRLVEEEDDLPWHEFLEQDALTFEHLSGAQVNAFLRHAPLDDVFTLARELDHGGALRLARAEVAPMPPAPTQAALDTLLGAPATRRGDAAAKLERNKETIREWTRRFTSAAGRLPIPKPDGTAAGIVEHYRRFFAPLRDWLAGAGGVLAAELSIRYRAWRQDHGYETYADQVETALLVLSDPAMLEQIRREGYRVILDEAQDTDRSQFSVLVEIARPPGSAVGTWPGRGGPGPRPGHFCMVGDAQQGIYSSRADIRNFQEHVAAFEREDGGERLTFDVTFRAPRRIVGLLNATLPEAFGPARHFNFGLPEEHGAPEPFLQVKYEELVAGPSNAGGAAWLMPLEIPVIEETQHVADRKLEHEARQVGRLLASGGPSAVGARAWGDICILAPRRAWLTLVRGELEAAGLKTALQIRRNRNGDNPAYAWVCGLVAVACDPENTFEWVGVLREVFGVSDAMLAAAVRGTGGLRWDEPRDYPAPIGDALEVVGRFISRVDAEGDLLGRFAADLAQACDLHGKARLADPDGGLGDELARLLAQADELGLEGAGPREWLRALLGSIDDFRASGRAAPDAINLITSHSAKGLEWPVVIPVGLWRKIGSREHGGLRIVSERGGVPRIVFDNANLGADARDSRERERLRDLVRLLYVTLTRARTALVIPWPGAHAVEKSSFARLWELDPAALDPLPSPGAGEAPAPGEPAEPAPGGATPAADAPPAAPAPVFPERIRPHELAGAPDLARSALHEASLDEPVPAKDGPDPLDYGVWWHEMLEFVPWRGTDGAVAARGAASIARAMEGGYGQRGREEWERLLASGPWRQMRQARWTALAEVGILAPLDPERWIDGVIDLVLHDPAAREVWIVDWKTNRRRAGEDDAALVARLGGEYRGQLAAYGACAAVFFPACTVRLWVYSTVAGEWGEIVLPG